MTDVQKQLLALHRYVSDQSYVSESWASPHFSRFVNAALEACQPEIGTSMGVTVAWSTSAPDRVCVTRHGIAVSGLRFLRELPLEGNLAKAFMEDLQVLAEEKARKEIQRERDLALAQEAQRRVTQLKASAVGIFE
jgi:hypothetical protein